MNPMTSLSALSANMGAFGIIATILAIIATVAAFILVVPESKREKLGRFGKFLHDAVNFKFLIVEKILQALYIFVTAYVILCGFFMLFMAPETWTGRHWLGGYGILLMVLGPIAVRLCYELLMMAVLLLKNVISINRKLKNQNERSADADLFAVPELLDYRLRANGGRLCIDAEVLNTSGGVAERIADAVMALPELAGAARPRVTLLPCGALRQYCFEKKRIAADGDGG